MSRKLYKGRSELVMNNFIDSDVVAFLRPLNWSQSFCLMSLYSIKYGIITYNSTTSKFLSFGYIIVIITMYALRVCIYNFENMFMFVNTVFDSIFYGFGFILNLYVCIIYKDYNINTILKIQELYHSKILDHNLLKSLTLCNWIYVLIVLFYYLINTFWMFLYAEMYFIEFLEMFCQTVLFSIDINTIYVTQIIKLLKAALRQWLSDVEAFKETEITSIVTLEDKIIKSNECSPEITFLKQYNPYLSSMNPKNASRTLIIRNFCQETYVKKGLLAGLSLNAAGRIHCQNIKVMKPLDPPENVKDHSFWKEKLRAYVTILEALEIMKAAFQAMILYHIAETFIHAVFYVYYVLLCVQSDNKNKGIGGAMLISSWVLKNFLAVTILSVEFESFLKSVNDVVAYSLTQMSNDKCSSQETKMYKNIVRMSHISCKFDVCNLFSLDAAMPRRLLALIATHTIVLLQFVLL